MWPMLNDASLACSVLIGDVRSLRLPGTYEEKIRHLGIALKKLCTFENPWSLLQCTRHCGGTSVFVSNCVVKLGQCCKKSVSFIPEPLQILAWSWPSHNTSYSWSGLCLRRSVCRMRKLNSVLVRNDWTASHPNRRQFTHDVCYAPRASDHMTRTGTTNPSPTYLSR